MASIDKRRDGFRVRWRDIRGNARSRQCPDKKTAKQVQREIERCIARGEDWSPDRRRSAPLLVGPKGWLSLYLADRTRVWSASTKKTRTYVLSAFVAWLTQREHRSTFGAEVFSRSVLVDYWNHLVEVDRLKANTANNYLHWILQWWRWAFDDEEWGDLVPRPRTIDLTTEPRPNRPAPYWSEMDAAISAVRHDHWRKLLWVLRCTGLRVEQSMALRWDDVDLDRGVLHVRPELGKSRQERRGRYITLAPVLIREIAGWGARTGYVIPWYEKRSAGHVVIAGIWTRAGVRQDAWQGRPFHSFRHGLISSLTRDGAPRDAIRCLVGHSSETLGDVYTDPTASIALSRAAADLIPGVRCVPVVSRMAPGVANSG